VIHATDAGDVHNLRHLNLIHSSQCGFHVLKNLNHTLQKLIWKGCWHNAKQVHIMAKIKNTHETIKNNNHITLHYYIN